MTNETSGNTLKDVPQRILIAEVVHTGSQLILPEGMDLSEAAEIIQRRQAFLEEEMGFSEVYSYFPLDGANALTNVLERMFGWAQAIPTPGPMGEEPPQVFNVEVAPKEFRKINWGRFALPGCENAYVDCSAAHDGSSFKFALAGNAKRKYAAKLEALFAEVRKELDTASIYRGQAIKIRFKDDYGRMSPMPDVSFMDLTDIDESMAIYSDSVQRQLQINLFTPIERVTDCLANGIPVKRGVMLAGTYGTGKTLGAKVAAKKAVATGNTFVYITHADELNLAIDFAKQYQSPACVIFCEDIDRAVAGERTTEMDDILNIIDGIDTKTVNVITVLTSNHIEAINPALLRPGRLDAVIHVTPPDEAAVKRLLRAYGAGAIDASVNLDGAAAMLAGNIPAVIAEVVKRAKLAELARTAPGTAVTGLSEQSIIEAAESVKEHVDLLERRAGAVVPRARPLEEVLAEVVRYALTRDPSRLASEG